MRRLSCASGLGRRCPRFTVSWLYLVSGQAGHGVGRRAPLTAAGTGRAAVAGLTHRPWVALGQTASKENGAVEGTGERPLETD